MSTLTAFRFNDLWFVEKGFLIIARLCLTVMADLSGLV